MSETVQWLPKLRVLPARRGIGSTMISAIVGLNPYKTKFDAWLELKGAAEAQEQSEPMKWGLRMEPLIANAYVEETGNVLVKPAGVYQHEKFDWMTGSPDYFLRDKPAGIDAKNIRFKTDEWGEPGSDKVPMAYLIQAQWFLMLFGAKEWEIPALFGGNHLEIFRVEHNDKLANSLLESAEEFWTRYIIGSEQPEIEDSPKVRDWIKSKFPRHLKPMRKATVEEAVLAVELVGAKERLKAVKETVDSFEVKMKSALGDDEGLELANGKVTWRNNKDGTETNWEAAANELIETVSGLHYSGDETARRIISKHTQTKPGARVLRVIIKE